MAYISLAGLTVLLLFAIAQWWGQMRRTVAANTRSRTFRHGNDSDWDCSAEPRFRLRR